MITNLTGQHLPAWLNRVEHDGEPELRTFAQGLRRGLAAVTAGLTLPYSSGPVEGNVNRKNDQTPNVRPGRIRPPSPPHPAPSLNTHGDKITEFEPESLPSGHWA